MIVKRGKGDFNQAYRPCRISEVAGNTKAKKIIENAFKENKIPHNFLFHGLSGAGKTTFARIIEMGLNCEKGPTSEPCCECSYCKRIINRKGTLAVLELNAVEKTKDELKTILQEFDAYGFGKLEGCKKSVLLIDECHGLTKDQAELFLKYTEDVHKDNFFIFCTTNPEKFLSTLRDRCTIQVEFTEVPNEEIFKLLTDICEKEYLKADEDLLNRITKESNGKPRIAVNRLQQSFLAEEISKKKIRSLEGINNILAIAPHEPTSDDDNVDAIVEKLYSKLGCYAVINEKYKRNDINLNDINDVIKKGIESEFLAPIKKFKDDIIKRGLAPLIILVHGAEDANMDTNGGEDVQILIGCGQGENGDPKSPYRPTLSSSDYFGLEKALANANLIPLCAPTDSSYCAHDKNNLNQLFNLEKDWKKYYDPRVRSVQLEIRKHGLRRDPIEAAETGEKLSKAIESFIPVKQLPATTQNTAAISGENEIQPDDQLVDKAFNFLKETFRKHFHNAMVEAGRYIIDTFYDGKEREAFAKNKTTDQPPNLKRLIDKIREAPKDPSESVPSIAWFYNAVNLAAHEAICEKEGFQTFRMLGHSHKLQLLTVPKLKKIQKDEFDEAILPAFEVKEKLAKVALDKPFSVREFKDYINRKFPSNQKQNPKTLLKQHEKQLIKMLNQAKEQIQPDGPLAGAYEKVLRQVETLLGEIKKAEKKKPKKSSNKSEKQKIQTEDGVEKEAAGGKLLSGLPN